MAKEYHVIITSTFDPDTKLYKFDNEDDAIACLHWCWEDAYNSSNYLDEKQCIHEDESAMLVWDDGDRMDFIIKEETDEIPKQFWKVKDSYMKTRR